MTDVDMRPRHFPRRCCRHACLLVGVALAGCGDSPTGAGRADLTVVVAQAGNGSDADGVVIEIVDQASGSLRSVSAEPGTTVHVDGMGAGAYVVRLSGVAEQCISDPLEVPITLRGQPAEVRLTLDCVGRFAYTRWFSTERQDVMYLDEHGVDRTIFQGAWDIPRDWSPDGRFLLVDRWVGDRCETYRVGLDGSVAQVGIGPSSVANSRWSPAGDLIAVQYGPCSDQIDRLEVVLLDANSLAPVDTIPMTADELDVHPVWSPDGGEVAFVRSDLALYTYVPASGELQLVSSFARPVDFPVWSPDGEYIAVTAFFPQQLVIVNRATGHIVTATPEPITAVGGAATWLPDSRTVLFDGIEDGTETLYTISVSDGVTRQFTAEVPDIVGAGLSVGPDGRVLFVARATATNVLFVADADGHGARPVKSYSGHLQLPLWQGTGGTIAGARVSVIAGRAMRGRYAERLRD